MWLLFPCPPNVLSPRDLKYRVCPSMRLSMKEDGEREEACFEGCQAGLSSTPKLDSPAPSSLVLDDKDSKILSLTRDRPTTMLNMSEKMDVSFVECLHRVQRLRRMGLLKRIEGEHHTAGLHLYAATHEDIRIRSIICLHYLPRNGWNRKKCSGGISSVNAVSLRIHIIARIDHPDR